MFNNAIFAILATIVPAACALPVDTPNSFKLPSCAADQCLLEQPVPALFDGCNPSDLACLCALEQSEVERYVSTVQPCIDDPELVGQTCTDGAIFQYKDLLTFVCRDSFSKNATWAPTA